MKLTRELQSKLASYFIERLRCVIHSTGWLRQGTCPECGKDKKFGINLGMNRTNCFSCAYHPPPLQLLIKLENLNTYNDAINFLHVFDGADYLDIPMPMLEEREVKLPESFTLLSLGSGPNANRARNYMANRGYDVDDLTLRGVGYCTAGPYAYRIIIPYYAKGQLVYFNARQFVDVGPKHKNPGKEEFGIGKSQLIYNVDALNRYQTIYMVESATNALTLGDHTISFGGKMVSDYQLSVVLNSPAKRCVLIWDPDAVWEAYRVALKICEHKQVKVVELPWEARNWKGEKKFNPDVNDLGKPKTLSIMKKFEYLNYSALYKKFIKLPKPEFHEPDA